MHASRFDRAAGAYLHASGSVIKVAAVAALAAMVAVNGLEIAWRLGSSGGLSWVQEFSIIVAMVLYFLTYALIAKDREYIRIDLVAELLGRTARRWFSILIRLGVLAFHGTVAWYAVMTSRFAALFETHVLGWPETVYYLPLAVGCADVVLTELIYLVWQLRGDELGEHARTGIIT